MSQVLRLFMLLVAAAQTASAGNSVEPQSVPAAPEQRIGVSLDGPWKFLPAFKEIEENHLFLQNGVTYKTENSRSDSDRNVGWIEPGFDDSLWLDIAVPASWNTEFEDLWSYEGTGWYRKQFAVPDEWVGKRVVLVFDGANYRTVLYVNGTKVGVHDGGYTQFRFAIDPYLHVGELNTLAVAVDNESRPDRVPMERHDWWDHGGIYRPLRLEVTDQSHFDEVAITTDALSQPRRVHVATGVRVEGALRDGWYVIARLFDAGGQEVAATRTPVQSGSASIPQLNLIVENARLWSPADPYLYSFIMELRETASNKCRDTWRAPVGIRTIQVDGDRLLLNGAPFLVKGVNRYENYPDSGMTSTEAGLAKDMALIKGLGANALRCHYTYAPGTYDAFDRAGLFAVCEVPLYQWGRPGHSEQNLNAAKQQLQEIVQTLRNHPSVMMWSVSNENRIHPREPGREHARLSRMVVRGNQELVDLAHKLDSTRPVIEPSNCWPDDEILAKTDLNSVNVYVGAPTLEAAGLNTMPGAIHEKFAQLRGLHPNKPILATEFGCWALRGLKTDYFPGELYQALLLSTAWETFLQEPGFVGGFVWCFADSDVHRKFSSIYEMRCAYGLYDLHRRPKESANVLRELWTGHP